MLCAYTEERWDELFAAVMSVRGQTVAAREIIIVIDNNSTLAQTVRRGLPGIQVLENSGPRGAGASRNLGVAAACGAIIAFLDDDAQADHRWIERALSAFEDPGTIGVGETIEPRGRTPHRAGSPRSSTGPSAAPTRAYPQPPNRCAT